VSDDWKEASYRKTLEGELRGLERRLAADSICTVEELEGTLKHLYMLIGSDWGGRGEVQNTCLEATAAAYEAVIARLKAPHQKRHAPQRTPP
jgi:hypothetical protein